jgi:hypothetical protein
VWWIRHAPLRMTRIKEPDELTLPITDIHAHPRFHALH